MKKNILIMAFVAAASLALVGCSKDFSLVGTKWSGLYTTQETSNGNTVTYYAYYDVFFADETTGQLDLTLDYAMQGAEPDNYGSAKVPFTYTFDKETNKGTITGTAEGSDREITELFTYNEESDIITIYEGSAAIDLKRVED